MSVWAGMGTSSRAERGRASKIHQNPPAQESLQGWAGGSSTGWQTRGLGFPEPARAPGAAGKGSQAQHGTLGVSWVTAGSLWILPAGQIPRIPLSTCTLSSIHLCHTDTNCSERAQFLLSQKFPGAFPAIPTQPQPLVSLCWLLSLPGSHPAQPAGHTNVCWGSKLCWLLGKAFLQCNILQELFFFP